MKYEAAWMYEMKKQMCDEDNTLLHGDDLEPVKSERK